MNNTLEFADLRKLLRHEPETGKLFWRKRDREGFISDRAMNIWNTRYAGEEAFITVHPKGYLRGVIWGKFYFAHRVIWAMETGAWPEDQIDHINGDPSDNRMENLREVDTAENQKNQKRHERNTSGVTGVQWSKAANKWGARIWHKGKSRHLGLFDTIEEAAVARKAAEAKYGFHKNHGRAS